MRDQSISIKVTEEERNLINDTARFLGLCPSTFLRVLGLREADKILQNKESSGSE